MSAALDSEGQPLHRGSRVRAWWDGTEYTATVDMVFDVQTPFTECGRECWSHRHLLLSRDSDGALMENTSDAVTVIS